MAGLWFSENDNDILQMGWAIKDCLFTQQTPYQKIEVYESKGFGRLLVIDGFMMLSEMDEFVYHEMISHVPLLLHPNPKHVLIIGGGDGGTVREVAKHPGVEKITLCEIDQVVIDASRTFLPAVSSALDDPRVDIRIGDGVAHVCGLENDVDVMIIDSTDPIGPGEGLFTAEFYASVKRALRPDGVMVAQTESPWHEAKFLRRIYRNIADNFDCVKPYVAPVPTYPRGFWSWTLAGSPALNWQGLGNRDLNAINGKVKYLCQGMLSSVFELPPFYAEKLEIK